MILYFVLYHEREGFVYSSVVKRMSRAIILHAEVGVEHPPLRARSVAIVASKYLIFLAFLGARAIYRIGAVTYPCDNVDFLGVNLDKQVANLVSIMLH